MNQHILAEASFQSCLRTIAGAPPGKEAVVFAHQAPLAIYLWMKAGKDKVEGVDRVNQAGTAIGLDVDYVQECLSYAVKATEAAPDSAPREYKKPSQVNGQDGAVTGHDGSTATAPPQEESPAADLLPSPSKPMAVARVFVAKKHTEGGELTLRYWRGAWWSWRRAHWRESEPREIRSELYAFTEHSVYKTDKGMDAAWAPNRHKVGDLLEALGAICLLADDTDQPSWLDRRAAGSVVAMTNGLLDIATRDLVPHTPLYFNTTSVPFDYDPRAPQPERWLGFLKELWPDDTAAIDALGEWFGYVVSGRLDLHKILLMVGPTRGGKGAIARILGELVGNPNVCGPTLNSLSGDFGLAPLIGKSLAVVADMRISGRNTSVVVERLLSISGEDTLTVNRKYRDQWTGKLSARFHIVSNELPNLGDASAAIIGRFIMLLTTHSWLGKEDRDLEPELQAELPGILNWALTGLERLVVANGNRFTNVEAGLDALTVMRDLASPVAAFGRDQCETGAEAEITVDAIYSAYRAWCDENGHAKTTKQTFGRNLRAAFPQITIQRPRDGEDHRVRVYVGIALKKKDREEEGPSLICQ
jgi:putative DNA primase/helicase